jgi:cytochrome oxidase Cu insertion factor (SCO1/SenC/PrrC family)
MNGKRLLLVFLVAGGLAGCNKSPAGPQPKATVAAGQVGSRLPNFVLTDFQGNEISSSALRGNVVLIDIWATWC